MHHLNSIYSQKGAVTLLTSLMMLLVISAVTFAVGRVAINETRLVSDEQRRYIARMAANAGVDRALLSIEDGVFDYISGSVMTDANFDVYFCDPLKAVSGGSETVDECDYVNSDLKAPTSTDRSVLIASKGTYDGATQYINGVASYKKTVGNSIDAPVIAGSVLDVSGSASIVNNGGRITVWSRNSVDVGNGSSTQLDTKILAPQFSNSDYKASLKEGGDPTSTVTGTTAGKKGIDIVENDLNLGSSPEKLFDQFFGGELGDWRDALASEIYSDEVTGDRYFETSDFGNVVPEGFSEKRRIYYEGNLSISGNEQYGTQQEPIVLIVDGNLSFTGGAKIYGIVFVTGDLSGGGNGTCDPDDGCYKVNGSVLVGGQTDLQGNFGVNFDKVALEPLENEVSAELVAGGVKDWW
jgi:hypothetical protein